MSIASRDIEHFSPKNTGVKRGFIRRVIYDNWLEILAGILIIVSCWVIALVFIDKLPPSAM